MASRTKAQPSRSRQLSGTKLAGTPLPMVRGNETYYDVSVIERARKDGVAIKIIRTTKSGKTRLVLTKPRKVHRNLLDTFGALHENAGKGKYIPKSAVSPDGKVVSGMQNVCPYLAEEGSYFTIIQAFMKEIGTAALRGLKADIKRNQADGIHLAVRGAKSKDGAVLLSPWLTAEQLWEIAQKLNRKLSRRLGSVKSHVKGVRKHLPSKEKFMQNMDVLRRARQEYNAASGTTRYAGGATPYSMPMEQCNMALDHYFLTTGVEDGVEVGEYFYRLAIGRSIPWVLPYGDWLGLDTNSQFAYLDNKVLERARKLSRGRKATVKTAA